MMVKSSLGMGAAQSGLACTLCPRRCGANREGGQRGFCGEDARLRLASACLHFGEEPPISGEGGSGAIFVCGCNLRCVFCQNYQISQMRDKPPGDSAEAGKEMGAVLTTDQFARICLALQHKGAENINIVTGSHAVPAIVAGIAAAREQGLVIPCLWNSSAYESAEALMLLQPCIAMYLPDLKTLDRTIAADFFNAPDYPETACAAIKMMIASGAPVIIRHLVLPGFLDATKKVLDWIAQNAKPNVSLSLMTQYTPLVRSDMPVHEAGRIAAPDRFLSDYDYQAILTMIDEIDRHGIEGFYQELETGSDWLPDFALQNPFSPKLARPVWHWKTGFV
jgi:putative pyruvate formate lyase activating enzyme